MFIAFLYFLAVQLPVYIEQTSSSENEKITYNTEDESKNTVTWIDQVTVYGVYRKYSNGLIVKMD